MNKGGGMKYNSVADMKRHKQRHVPSPLLNGLPRTILVPEKYDHHYVPPMKSFNSSPG